MTNAILVFVAVAVFMIIKGATGAALFFQKKDDTDPPNGHSGMRLFIDAKTGCHYLGNPMGGITPRVDRKGQHICEPLAEAQA